MQEPGILRYRSGFLDGRSAYFAGKPRKDAPPARTDREALAYRSGWLAGRADARTDQHGGLGLGGELPEIPAEFNA